METIIFLILLLIVSLVVLFLSYRTFGKIGLLFFSIFIAFEFDYLQNNIAMLGQIEFMTSAIAIGVFFIAFMFAFFKFGKKFALQYFALSVATLIAIYFYSAFATCVELGFDKKYFIKTGETVIIQILELTILDILSLYLAKFFQKKNVNQYVTISVLAFVLMFVDSIISIGLNEIFVEKFSTIMLDIFNNTWQKWIICALVIPCLILLYKVETKDYLNDKIENIEE